MMLRRHLVVVVLALGMTSLGSGVTSLAQTSGSELSEPISAEAAGDQAYAAVMSLDSFSTQGGEAVFEPGTAYEEVFTYSSVDFGANRLLGLARPAPIAHSAGVFVQASPSEGSASQSPPAAETEASTDGQADATNEEGSAHEAGTPDLDPGPATIDGETQEAPFTSDELEPPAIGSTCAAATNPTCDGILGVLISDPIDALCDPADTGQTCQQFLTSLLLGVSPDVTCEGEICGGLEDPLGPWSVCDVDDNGAECPDPDDLIDLVWGVDNPLSNLKCTASVTGPSISDGGGMVRGKGAFNCEEFVGFIEVTVCLYRDSGGAWVKMGCRHKEAAGGPGYVEQKIAEPCVKQQTASYKIRARGHATDGLGPEDEDRDTATATAMLYCPGPSADGASLDAIEYAESWL